MKSERIKAILSCIKGDHVLNVGCVNHSIPTNDAEKDRWLHQQLIHSFPAASVLGLDIDVQNVERMRSRGMNVELGDAQNLAYNKAFETIILGELLEHLENPGDCLASCRRALKPGGRIVISTPNVFSAMLALMFLKNSDHAFNREHVVWFCPQTLRALIERCGFRVESFQFVDDLAPDVMPDGPYRLFTYLWLATRWLFPRRYRNTMIAVCVPSTDQASDRILECNANSAVSQTEFVAQSSHGRSV